MFGNLKKMNIIKHLIIIFCILFIGTLQAKDVGAQHRVRAVQDGQRDGRGMPHITDIYVAYTTIGDNEYVHAYPYTNSNVVIKAIVIVNGQAYSYLENIMPDGPNGIDLSLGSSWLICGILGAENHPSPTNLDFDVPDYYYLYDLGYQHINNWNSSWGQLSFIWKKLFDTETYWDGDYGRTYNYVEDDASTIIGGWGTNSNSGINLPEGLARYKVAVSYNGTQIKSVYQEPSGSQRSYDKATRIAIKSINNFGITTTDSESLKRIDYLRNLFSFLSEPYEYGGYWFGGEKSDTCVYGNSHYGIDCSGLVSLGARMAGYNWGNSWRKTCATLWDVTTAVDNEDVVPGNILLADFKGEHHVRTICSKNEDSIEVIAAEGQEDSVVRLKDLSLATETGEYTGGYSPRSLMLSIQ